jgi:hypothetical protein
MEDPESLIAMNNLNLIFHDDREVQTDYSVVRFLPREITLEIVEKDGIGAEAKEWWIEQFEQFEEEELLQKLEAASANSERGWNQTRRTIVDTVLAQLRKLYSNNTAV